MYNFLANWYLSKNDAHMLKSWFNLNFLLASCFILYKELSSYLTIPSCQCVSDGMVDIVSAAVTVMIW